MKDGILTLSGITFLKCDSAIFEHVRTTAVDNPIPKPFIAEVVTSRVAFTPFVTAVDDIVAPDSASI